MPDCRLSESFLNEVYQDLKDHSAVVLKNGASTVDTASALQYLTWAFTTNNEQLALSHGKIPKGFLIPYPLPLNELDQNKLSTSFIKEFAAMRLTNLDYDLSLANDLLRLEGTLFVIFNRGNLPVDEKSKVTLEHFARNLGKHEYAMIAADCMPTAHNLKAIDLPNTAEFLQTETKSQSSN